SGRGHPADRRTCRDLPSTGLGADAGQEGLSQQPGGKGRLRPLGLAHSRDDRLPVRGRGLQGTGAPAAMTDSAAPRQDGIRSAVLLSVGGLGLSSVATQLSLLRELLGAFSGNELVLGICLGNWLVPPAACAGPAGPSSAASWPPP